MTALGTAAAASPPFCQITLITFHLTAADASPSARAPILNRLQFSLCTQEMCSQASCGQARPVMPPSSPSLASSRSPPPPTLPEVRRRRLWSPPMRRKSPTTSRSRSSATSTAPRHAQHHRPRSSDDADNDIRPLSRSRRLGHRSHHDSRPPSPTSCPSEDEDDRENARRRSPSPGPPSTSTPSPPRTPPTDRRLQSVLQRPPRTQRITLRRVDDPLVSTEMRASKTPDADGSTGSCAPSRCDKVGPHFSPPPRGLDCGGMKEISLFMKSKH